MKNTLLKLDNVTISFTKPDGQQQKILDNINLDIQSDQILAIVGKSGSGKSTLLRIIADLIKPTEGMVKFEQLESDKDFGISMIFQSFALFPWLTVLENVELGLESMDISESEKRQRALESIDLIGLDGFESAYPRELSGGMKQRVGFARALVVRPKILLMDEPFSALDVLTSNTLKNDFLDLWISKKTPLKSVIIVTHSIEEATTMADKVIILKANPGHIAAELGITLPRPRDPQTQEFRTIVDQIYTKMATAQNMTIAKDQKSTETTTIIQKLPQASANQLAALTSTLANNKYDGKANLAELVKILHIKTLDMLYITDALNILKLATIVGGDIQLNDDGKLFAKGNLNERKKFFAKHLLANVPLAAYIVKILHERPGNKAPRARFQTYLEDHLSRHEAYLNLKTIIGWGRYAEVFSYDDNKQIFSLENPTF